MPLSPYLIALLEVNYIALKLIYKRIFTRNKTAERAFFLPFC